MTLKKNKRTGHGDRRGEALPRGPSAGHAAPGGQGLGGARLAHLRVGGVGTASLHWIVLLRGIRFSLHFIS